MRPHLAAEQARSAAARRPQLAAQRGACRIVQKAFDFEEIDHVASLPQAAQLKEDW
jgi:hypothetical protein